MDARDIDLIAWWGAGLSTLLALVKLWELWRDRFRINIGYNFTSCPDVGNEIHVRNLSHTPIILGSWELFYRSRLWPFRKDAPIDSAGPDACDLRIEPHSSQTLSFRESEHFDWSFKSMKGRSIYIRLFIAGRRSLAKKVHG